MPVLDPDVKQSLSETNSIEAGRPRTAPLYNQLNRPPEGARFLRIIMKSIARYAILAVALAVAVAAFLLFRSRSEKAPPSLSLLTVPPGFEVDRAAGPPLVERPIVADFDEQGRLYVAESSGSNDKLEKQLQDKPHSILRLEDVDGDGRFDHRTVFADRVMFPEGTLWYDGSLYVSAPPSIWKLTDTDGDGVADLREEWFQGKTLTGCGNDLHGPYLGPDGWIYWCKGGFAKQTYERPGRPPLVTRAAHIFRRRPGDSLVEPVLNGGMDNPVDVAFTPGGERILTATFLEHPQLGRRDALIHAIYGGLYGKQHDVIESHKKTGDLMPELTHYGPAAPCGLTRYASGVFGDEYRDNFFACLFNMRKVTRHALEPSGATFRSRDSDFLVSSSPDFHPTDVLEDADGSLLVIDTGGWYKLCCPTSQLAKPDVPGAIYRIRRKGAARIEDPRGLRLGWTSLQAAGLANLLADDRPAVRARAVEQLSKRGSESIPVLSRVLETSEAALARLNSVWSLTRIEAPEARAAVRAALADRDDSVRLAALHSAAVWRDSGALEGLLRTLRNDSAPHRRAAAEALGRIGDAAAVPALLEVAGSQHDRALEHSLTYALIEIADPVTTSAGLRSASPYTRRAALVALDQMDGSPLLAETVIPLLESKDLLVQRTAWWVASRHPDWGEALGGFFRPRLGDASLSPEARTQLEDQLAPFGSNPAIQALLVATIDRGATKEARASALRVMARAQLKEMPSTWPAALARTLAGTDPALRRSAVAVARALPVPEAQSAALREGLLRYGHDQSAEIEERVNALAAVPGGLSSVDSDTFALLQSAVQGDRPVAVRSAAAGVIEKSKLSREQLLSLAGTLRTAGPLELPRLLAPFAASSDESLGLSLLTSLRESKALSSLRADILLPSIAAYPETVRRRAAELLKSLNIDPAGQKARLDQMLPTLQGGDVRRGQAVFNGTKAACSTCHTIGYLGGKLGPDLTKIGQIRNEYDLLEAVVYPSASFVRSYEPMVVVTRSGERFGGVLKKDADDEVVLATGATDEEHIARAEVAEMRPGTVSVMPSGLDEQLSSQELADLLAFLKAARR